MERKRAKENHRWNETEKKIGIIGEEPGRTLPGTRLGN